MQLPQFVGKIAVDGEGIVTLTMASGAGAGPVHDMTLKFVPTRGADNKVTWTCMSTEIANRYLPVRCRSATK